MKRTPLDTFGLARVVEHGRLFETGTPVTFPYVHNDAKAPHFGAAFGQDVEPTGFYIQYVPDSGAPLPTGWSRGTVVLERPLVLVESFDVDHIYGPTGWKARLATVTGKRRKALTRRLMALGFDSIVAVRSDPKHGDSTTEIVVLRT